MKTFRRGAAKSGVFLVGRQLGDNENLGLGVLEAALTEARVPIKIAYLNEFEEMRSLAARVVRQAPKLVGLSLADGGSSVLLLAFGEMLRRMGFEGHITCGGQFATLARQWLLKRYRWLDSAVRFAGEVPIVRLAKALSDETSLRGVPGLTTREGDGAPAPVLDETGIERSPVHREFPKILSGSAAHVQATRGCLGRCGYCSPAALQVAEKREGRRAGVSNETLKRAGVGGVRRRSTASVCDELAALYHRKNVRYFYFVDEHLLPYEENAALDFLGELKQGLASRRVERFGIGTMLRADRLTPRVAEAFADAGLIRAFIGLELGDAEDARRYGRTLPGPSEMEILRTLHDRGVTTISNMMLVHPYANPESTARSLDLLETIPSGFFEVSRMMIYHGTKLHEKMAREGRLTGNPIRYGYSMLSSEMERFAVIANRLRLEAFHNYSAAYRAHEIALHIALSRRLDPDKEMHGLWADMDQVAAALRRIYIDAYRQGLRLATNGASVAAVDRFVREVSESVRLISRTVDECRRTLIEDCDVPLHRFNPFRAAAAASVLAFVMAGSSACTDSVTATGPSSTDSESSSEVCADGEVRTAEAEAGAQIEAAVPCFTGILSNDSGQGSWTASYGMPVEAISFHLDNCVRDDASESSSSLPGQALSEWESMEISCKDQLTYIRAVGPEVEAQGQSALDTIQNGCANDSSRIMGYMVVLDASGAVSDVVANPDYVSDDAPDQTTLDCIRTVLTGLSFPCFADMTLCPEFIIVE